MSTGFVFWFLHVYQRFLRNDTCIKHNEIWKTYDQSNDRLWHINKFDVDFELINKDGKSSNPNLRKERICVVSIDTRPLERFSDKKSFENMSFTSIAAYNSLFYGTLLIENICSNFEEGLLNSFLFIYLLAVQHGYDYKRIVAPPLTEHHMTWVKIANLYDVLHKYDVVVCFDPDVYVRNPETTIEFLMDRYNFTVNSSLLMASDPNSKENQDSKGRATLNMGFIIARNNNLTRQILRQLALCTEMVPGCKRWRFEWSHEQRAFSEYFRDRMQIGSELIIAPCNELNGFDVSRSGCHGILVTHGWTIKGSMKDRLKKLMSENLMMLLEKKMWKDGHVYQSPTSDIRALAL